jgi:gliding motility-associated-like protein
VKKLTTLMMMLLFNLSIFSQATKETLISTSEKHLKKLLSNPQSYQRESIDYKVIKSKDVLKYDLFETIYYLNKIIHKINYLVVDTIDKKPYNTPIESEKSYYDKVINALTENGAPLGFQEHMLSKYNHHFSWNINLFAPDSTSTNSYIQKYQKEKELLEDEYYNLIYKKENIENLIKNSKDEIEWCVVVINFRARNKYNGLVKEKCEFWFDGGSVTDDFKVFSNNDGVFTQSSSGRSRYKSYQDLSSKLPVTEPLVLEKLLNFSDFNWYYPNVFSPNGNGTNDVFKAVGGTYTLLYSLKIFNKAGEILFETNNVTEGWNGQFEEEPCVEGDYTYIAVIKNLMGETIQKRGTVTLIR